MKSTLILVALLTVGCPRTTVGPVTPAPDSDLLGPMCAHLQDLGCAEGDDVYNDDLPGPVDVPNQSCEDFYLGLQEEGFAVNPRCVLQVPECGLIEDYRAKNPETCW